MTTNTIAKKVINEELNGVEIYFSVFPLVATRENLKKNGFKWNHKKSCWYSRRTALTDEIANIIAETTVDSYKLTAQKTDEEIKEIKETKPVTKKAAKEVKNKFGVKVGDFFHMSWGYEQTNNNFFQVIALVGETSVRIREVNPEIIERSAVSGMSEDRVYKLDTNEILPPSNHTVFIQDQEKGDLKRLKSYRQDGTQPQINMTSYANAYYCGTDTLKAYDSWYY